MNLIPPNPPSSVSMSPARRRQIERLERAKQREMHTPDEPSKNKERRYKRDRRAERGDRLKAYDMRSGHDRRKTSRDLPTIEIEV